jgi:hypothetical protein
LDWRRMGKVEGGTVENIREVAATSHDSPVALRQAMSLPLAFD